MIPIPNHKRERGIQARGGIGRRSWKRGSTIASIRLNHPIRIPRGTPIRIAEKNPPSTICRLTRV